jgi:hypothetical protein
MKFSLKLLQSDSTIRQMILEDLIIIVQKSISSAIPGIITKVKTLIKESLKQQPEYASLTYPGGVLRLEFGIENPSLVEAAIDSIADTVYVSAERVKASNIGLKGGFVLHAMPHDDIQMISRSFIQPTEKGVGLEWLRWLLYEGTKPIIRGYNVQFKESRYSRTGLALMVESRKSWRVPSDYVGTIRNNWITKSIEDIDNQIISIIQNEIESKI